MQRRNAYSAGRQLVCTSEGEIRNNDSVRSTALYGFAVIVGCSPECLALAVFKTNDFHAAVSTAEFELPRRYRLAAVQVDIDGGKPFPVVMLRRTGLPGTRTAQDDQAENDVSHEVSPALASETIHDAKASSSACERSSVPCIRASARTSAISIRPDPSTSV